MEGYHPIAPNFASFHNPLPVNSGKDCIFASKTGSLQMRNFLKFILLLFLLGFGPAAAAQNDSDTDGQSSVKGKSGEKGDSTNQKSTPEKVYKTRIFTWQIDPFLGGKKLAPMDTLPLNFQNSTFPERNQTAGSEYLENIGSPFQSKVYLDRTEKTPFLFGRTYDNWITAPSEQLFYNTTTPYSNLRYLTTVGDDNSQEEDFKFLFTVNINKYLNIGIDYEILYARGFYDHNSGRDKLGNFFGNYQSPRYEAFWQLSSNYLENYENGGITDDRYITDPLLMSGGLKEYESLNVPVAFSDAKSQVKNRHLFFNHKYHIGFERISFVQKDSLNSDPKKPLPKGAPVPGDTIRTFVPVTSLIHTLYIDQSQRSYRSTTANLTYYDSIANISSDYTADTCSLLQIRNTFGLSLEEGFHKWAKFGLTAFLEHDFRRYMRLSPTATLQDTANEFSSYTYHNKSLLWGGGELSKRMGSILTYSAMAKVCMLGEDMGDFELSGNLNTTFKLWGHPVMLAADGFIKNLHPDYFMENYYSNNFSWSNSFQNEYKTLIRGTLDIPALGFKACVGIENLTNLVYFNDEAVPDQYSGNIQVLTFNGQQHLQAGILNWDNDLVYQLSSNQTILPLPDLTVYSNAYLKFMLSKVLTSQLGVDCRYNTAYYAQAYMPATGQFYNQQEIKIGNYPYMNAYANFHLKRMRFFLMYSHVSRLFASPNYFSAPHYPLNPAIVKVGLSWNFYD
jgi:hypothetical protein